MRENLVESRLTKGVEKLGGLCLKFESPGHRGVPDRIIFMDCGEIHFVELKAPGKKPRKDQKRWARILYERGQTVWMLDSPERVDRFLEWLASSSRWERHNVEDGYAKLPEEEAIEI